MAYINYNGNPQPNPFWDFVRSLDQSQQAGVGVDHPPSHGIPQPGPQSQGPHPAGSQAPPPPGPFEFSGSPGMFGAPPFNHGCRRGREMHGGPHGRHGRHGPHNHEASPHNGGEDGEEDPEASGPEGPGFNPDDPSAQHRGPHGHGGPYRGRGWRHGPGRRHGGARGFGGPWAADAAPFDLSALLGSLASHPLAQAFQTFVAQPDFGERAAGTSNTEDFTPPIDVFSLPASYILHVALPGAKKEDVGVNWDAEKGELNIAGVVYRPGDETFLKNLKTEERKLGVFERSVALPLAGEEKEEIDGDAIAAKLEDGVLVITVPKVEKEWTEVKRVDIV